MTIYYYISTEGSHNFNKFKSLAQAIRYCKRMIAEGYESATISTNLVGNEIKTYKTFKAKEATC
jgi:hypothetical protein